MVVLLLPSGEVEADVELPVKEKLDPESAGQPLPERVTERICAEGGTGTEGGGAGEEDGTTGAG